MICDLNHCCSSFYKKSIHIDRSVWAAKGSGLGQSSSDLPAKMRVFQCHADVRAYADLAGSSLSEAVIGGRVGIIRGLPESGAGGQARYIAPWLGSWVERRS